MLGIGPVLWLQLRHLFFFSFLSPLSIPPLLFLLLAFSFCSGFVFADSRDALFKNLSLFLVSKYLYCSTSLVTAAPISAAISPRFLSLSLRLCWSECRRDSFNSLILFVAFSIQMHFALRSPSVSCFLFYSYRFYLPLKKQTGFPHTFSFPFPHVIFCLTLPFSPSSLFSFLSVPPVVLRFALMARQILSGYFVWREVEFRWWCHDFWQLPFPLACLLFFSFSPFLMLLCCISRTLPHIFLPIN